MIYVYQSQGSVRGKNKIEDLIGTNMNFKESRQRNILLNLKIKNNFNKIRDVGDN